MFNFFSKKTTEDNGWKEKAKKRSKEIENLKKQIKDLQKSRDKWKFKACKQKKEIDDLTGYLKKNF